MSDETDNQADALEHRLAVTRVVLRPVGTPLPLGLLGLAVATATFSALQLKIVPSGEADVVALTALAITVPLQLLAAVLGLLARDPVAGTGMGLLGATWALVGLATLTSPPGSTSSALGVVLVVVALSLLVPVAAALAKVVVAVVMTGTAVRFAVTGVAEITGSPGWEQAAGVAGLVLAVLALYAALALQLEDVKGRAVLPLLRRGEGRLVTSNDIADQIEGIGRAAGVRQQL